MRFGGPLMEDYLQICDLEHLQLTDDRLPFEYTVVVRHRFRRSIGIDLLVAPADKCPRCLSTGVLTPDLV